MDKVSLVWHTLLEKQQVEEEEAGLGGSVSITKAVTTWRTTGNSFSLSFPLSLSLSSELGSMRFG